ncbi:hypothetical protein SERLA73DRAFT_191212, partial [Serpula lacrymans var. lacrymans S7.3]
MNMYEQAEYVYFDAGLIRTSDETRQTGSLLRTHRCTCRSPSLQGQARTCRHPCLRCLRRRRHRASTAGARTRSLRSSATLYVLGFPKDVMCAYVIGQCSDFTCCGLALNDLHELIDHFEESHVLVVDADGNPLYP